MILSLDMVSETPIYTQICHQIIKSIAMKDLQEGDELPSVRSLASDIGVNLHTINKAYNILKQDGFLVVNRRKGVVVNGQAAYASNAVYEEGLKKHMETLLIESIARGMDYTLIDEMVKSIIKDVKGEF